MQILIRGGENMDWIELSLDGGIQRQASVVVVNIKCWSCGLLHWVVSWLYANIPVEYWHRHTAKLCNNPEDHYIY
jgi:hypothetical protein